MAADDPTIRRAQDEDLDRILELIRVSLGETERPWTRDVWRWKHTENPFGRSPVMVAEAAGEIVGLRVFMRWSWSAGSDPVPAVRAVDTATHPDWRGRGIFRTLTLKLVEEMREEGVAFVFNTPNRMSAPGYLKMGWSRVGRIPLWVRPRRPLRLLRAAASRGGLAPAAHEGRAVAGGSIEALLSEPRLPDFLEAFRGHDTRYHTPRTLEYLRWRYQSIPAFQYRAEWDLDRGPGAVVIYREKRRRRARELRLCELLVGSGRGSAAQLRRLLHRVRRNTDADFDVAAAPRVGRERAALLWAGFLPAPRLGPIFTARPLQDALDPDPLRLAHWRHSIGDLELF